MHKETTAFGPLLWLQVRVDKAPMMIYPPAITVPPPLATPPSSLPEQSLTNENLLKSIGFIPGGDLSPRAGDHAYPGPPTNGCASEEDEEVLLTTFDVVETPKESVHSLSSFNSVNQSPSLDFQAGKGIPSHCINN